MQIGPYPLSNRLILAPMAGVTDRPFRNLCRDLGAALAVSEMVSAQSVLSRSAKTLERLDHRGEPAPIAVQILGADPEKMAEAARANVDLGAQIIDINLGCPAKKVCRVAAGSALLRDERRVARILEAVVAAVPVPVTLKMRTGWSPETRNAPTIARIAVESGVSCVTVHGRTRACGYRGEAEYETVRLIKQTVAIPVVANGDIDSPEKARFVLDYTGADAIMIGRAAQGRPWIFGEIQGFLQSGVRRPPPQVHYLRAVVERHLRELYGFYGEHRGVRVARKHIAWYSKRRRGGVMLRQQIFRTESPAEQLKLIGELFPEEPTKEDLAA
jgi:tRNA-dihydrouridine synthase B